MEKSKDKTGRTKKHIVPLERFLIRGIHYEEVSEFADSIFSDVYTRATRMIESVVRENRKKTWNRGNSQRGREVEIANAISFIGRRGTGKTSAMLSFSEALKCYSGDRSPCFNNKNIRFKEEADMKNVRFFCLDCIDTAILEESEDVFVLVLAGMLNQMEADVSQGREQINGYERRGLITMLENIYNDFNAIKEAHGNANDEYSAYERMKNITSSQRIREEFAKLVLSYLRYMLGDENRTVDETYLVITLDDLDMAYYQGRVSRQIDKDRKSYEIMNSISKYLSVPGVIVLSAYNHMNLHDQCIRAFDVVGDGRNEGKSESDVLATQFMEKVFSPVYRLYMPSWRKRDYEEKKIFVDLGEPGKEEDIFSKYRGRADAGHTELSVKQTIMIMYAEILEIYYDMRGKKTHFLEPDSLRAMNNAIRLLIPSDFEPEPQAVIQYDEEEAGLIFKKIKDDIYYRFIEERLYLGKEKELFKEWLEMRIDRRSEAIVHLVSPGIAPLGLFKKRMLRDLEVEMQIALDRQSVKNDFAIQKQLIEDLSDNSNVVYSYAELVHCIYHMTRERDAYSRALVACILHSYTIYLSQIYFDYRRARKNVSENEYRHYYSLDEKEKPSYQISEELRPVVENYELLKGVIGQTVCGRWAEYYFPHVQTMMVTQEKSVDVILGYVGNCRFTYTAYVTEDEVEALVKEWIYMLSLRPDLKQCPELQLDVRMSEEDETARVSLIGRTRSDFEVTAFLKHTFLYADFLGETETLLMSALENALVYDNNFIGTAVKSKEKKHFLQILKDAIEVVYDRQWESYCEWDREYGNEMLPVHDFDLCYNLIKRMFQDGKKAYRLPKQFDNRDTFCQAFREMLRQFQIHLGKIDEDYYLSDEKDQNGRVGFGKRFSACPYVALAEEIFDNRKSVGNVQRFINMVIEDVQNVHNLHVDPTPENDAVR